VADEGTAVAGRGSVVVTGASRGLGLATAAHLHRRGWTVVCAVRTPDVAFERLREATGATAGDPRLIAVRLDLDDPASIESAARDITGAVGAPDAVVHNAGVAGVGCVEEMPMDVGAQIFSTNYFGPVRLTRELLPGLRAAGRGRIVVVSSQGGVRGMPGISAYSAAKGALERWAEALAHEVAPFGLGVTVLVTGTFRTDILELTPRYTEPGGPYAGHHEGLDRVGKVVLRMAAPPERFGPAVARAVADRAPFVRRAVGFDARLLVLGNRLLPTSMFQRVAARALGLPRPGSLRGDPADPVLPAATSLPDGSDGEGTRG
jgi:NAD(P)-dependent dehydrogenase (short-subunit alcohol dehydrogenase family)